VAPRQLSRVHAGPHLLLERSRGRGRRTRAGRCCNGAAQQLQQSPGVEQLVLGRVRPHGTHCVHELPAVVRVERSASAWE